ncbi:MAG: TonB-dependent receptor [Bacteroidota bacterium]
MRFLILFFLCVFSARLIAQQNDSLPSQSFELDPIVLTAFEAGQNLLQQSGSVTVLGQRELNRDQDLIIANSLNRVPGVLMHNGTLGTNRITIRGIGARSLFSTTKIRAYLDDIPLTTGDGETTLEDIDLRMLQRVEVIRGPASSLYGAGLAGTINLRFRDFARQQTGVGLEAQIGSFGLQRYQAWGNWQQEEGGMRLHFSDTQQEGFRQNSQYQRRSLGLSGKWQNGEKGQISLLANYVDVLGFIPSSIDSADFVEDHTQAAFTWNRSQGFEDYQKLLMGLSYRHQFSEKLAWTSSVYGGFRSNYELRPFNLLQEQSQNTGVRTRLEGQQETAALKLKWQVGGEAFREAYQWLTTDNADGAGTLGDILSNNLETRQLLNLFAQLDIAFGERLSITGGLNFNRTEYDYQDVFAPDSIDLSGAYQYPLTFSPRLAFNYQLQPNWHLYGNISHGFSPPSLSETLTPDGQINPEILPETGWNFELGQRYRSADQRTYIEATIFYLAVRDLLVARRTDNDQFVGINAGQADHLGFEFSADQRLYQSGQSEIRLFANYTLARYQFSDFVDGEDDFGGNALPGVPPHHINAGVDAVFGHFRANLNYRFVDAMPLRDDNEDFSDAYSLWNLRLDWEPPFGERSDWAIFGGVQNLFDVRYASMILINAGSFGNNAPRYYYPGAPRNYYLGLRLFLHAS